MTIVITGPCRVCGSAGVVPTCCSGSGRCNEPHYRSGERVGPTRPCPHCAARTALAFLLVRIGSWTEALWDQHVRDEYGDEVADLLIAFLDAHIVPVKQYAESPAHEVQRAEPLETGASCDHPLDGRHSIASGNFNLASWCSDCGALDSGGGWLTPLREAR